MRKNLELEELYFGLDEREREESQKELMYEFIDKTDMDVDEVYSLVFMGGRKITWQ